MRITVDIDDNISTRRDDSAADAAPGSGNAPDDGGAGPADEGTRAGETSGADDGGGPPQSLLDAIREAGGLDDGTGFDASGHDGGSKVEDGGAAPGE